MADPISTLVNLGITLFSIGEQKDAQRSQDKVIQEQRLAERTQWRSDIRTYEFNIDQLGKDIGAIRREGDDFQRLQGAAMGASGATLGVGTPLMNMIRTKAGIDIDIRDKESEIAFLQEEIAFTEENLGFVEGEEPAFGDIKTENGKRYIWTKRGEWQMLQR